VSPRCCSPPPRCRPGAPAKKKWSWTAPGLVSAAYDGGSSAYVHLKGYSEGGHDAVTLNSKGTSASGVTANGTRFVCKPS